MSEWNMFQSTAHPAPTDSLFADPNAAHSRLLRCIRWYVARVPQFFVRLADAASTAWLWRFGIALFFVSASLGTEMVLQHFFPYPFLLVFFAGVVASAWYGGAVPGMLAALLSILAVDYFFIPPLDSFMINPTASTYFAAFTLSALMAGWASASKQRSDAALKEAHGELENRVAERTAQLQISNAGLLERERQLEVLIGEREQAEQALMKAQSELAHLSRVLTVGELTTSIAHEVSQPLTSVIVHGDVCLDCLSAVPPDLEEARTAAEMIIEDGTRAAAVLGRIRALFKKEAPIKDWLDMNEVIRELTVIVRDAAIRQQISLHTELAPDLPLTLGDRVQLQQVLLNLMVNGMDAMSECNGRRKELFVRSRCGDGAEVRISVEDRGVGLTSDLAGKIFDPFFTTKPNGIGVGLSISRSIVESHGGRLWAFPSPAGGAVLEFAIPTEGSQSDA